MRLRYIESPNGVQESGKNGPNAGRAARKSGLNTARRAARCGAIVDGQAREWQPRSFLLSTRRE
ncbi:hypothetical protein Y027_5128 [Burkholderia pseudomallei TSV5]|nr:hypothetical protein Y027_5128 [Burkholderia pseudomallei TSV5]KGX79441.1 hypothetical protein Y033_5669 [Burkholderia pseudomallei MSHR435]